MLKEKLQEFTVRVTQANRSELIVIMYDMMKADIDYAKELLAQGELPLYEKECRHAQKILNELMGALDYHYAISYDLLSLYSFMNKNLVAAMMKKDASYFKGIELILEQLSTGFQEVSKQDTSGAMMQNTQQVFAGLTYGRGTLNESTIGLNDANRGFVI